MEVVKRTRLIGIASALAALGLLFVTKTLSDRTVFQLPNAVQDLLTLSLSIVIEAFPFVVLGIVLSVVVQVWLPANALTRWLPASGIWRRLYISLFGVLLPVCECGNVPLARGLVARGLTPAESLTFLLAAPILNPITLITTYQAFSSDVRVVIVRAIAALLIANLVGWIFSAVKRQETLLTPVFAASCEAPDAHAGHRHRRFDQSLKLFGNEMGVILPALFVGSLLAGLIQVAVPREILLSLGANPLLAIGVMMALAFIVAICSNVDAFFALAFSSTFSIGSIVAFLVFGPMVDVKMLGLMRTTYRTSVLVKVSVVVGLASIVTGLGVHYAL